MKKLRSHYVGGERAGEQREQVSTLESHISLNEELPNRGLNSFIDDWPRFQREALSLVETNQVASPMSISDSTNFITSMIAQTDHFTQDDADTIIKSTALDYVSLCMNKVRTDSLSADNKRAIQDAQNVRGASGASVWMGAHGSVLALSKGAALGFQFNRSSEYPDRIKGCLGRLPIGEVFDPFCIGALVTKYQAGKWTEEDYKKYGPNFRMTIESIYFYDFWNCRLFRVFKRDELFNKCGCRNIPGGFFRDSMGDGQHYIGMFAQPKIHFGDDGLPSFRYNITTKEEGVTNKYVHQITEK